MSKARDETRNLLFEAQNIVKAIGLAAENLSDDNDEFKFVIQSLAKVAAEKIDEVAGGAVLDPPVTKRQVAKARAYMERTGAFIKPSEAA
jgi:hypothetical protein